MENLTALEEKYAALGEEIAKLKAAPKEWPQEGDKVWLLCTSGEHYEDTYFRLSCRNYLDQGSLFRMYARYAERDARAVVAELRRQPGRKKFIAANNNYCLCVDLSDGEVFPDNLCGIDGGWHSIYFESEQATINAIKAVGQERIVKAARWWAMGE